MKGGAEPLTSEVVEAMTTNETFFFRDKIPFDHLQRDGTAGAGAGARRPPTPADLVRGVLDRAGALFDRDVRQGIRRRLSGWRVEIVATDLSQAVLEKSKAGLFSQFEVQRGLPIQMLVKYFTQIGELWQLNADIRGMVQHRQLNLLQDFSHLGTFDVIFCRNVLIYFDQDTKISIFERLSQDARARRRAGAGRGRIRGRDHRRLQALSGSARALSARIPDAARAARGAALIGCQPAVTAGEPSRSKRSRGSRAAGTARCCR